MEQIGWSLRDSDAPADSDALMKETMVLCPAAQIHEVADRWPFSAFHAAVIWRWRKTEERAVLCSEEPALRQFEIRSAQSMEALPNRQIIETAPIAVFAQLGILRESGHREFFPTSSEMHSSSAAGPTVSEALAVVEFPAVTVNEIDGHWH